MSLSMIRYSVLCVQVFTDPVKNDVPIMMALCLASVTQNVKPTEIAVTIIMTHVWVSIRRRPIGLLPEQQELV